MPPAAWAADPVIHDRIVRGALHRGWHPILDLDGASVVPFAIAGQPLLWTSEERVLANVCTHRAATLVDAPCAPRAIRCPYHGRRFDLTGRVVAAPGFEAPPQEPLPSFPLARHGPFRFTSPSPAVPFADWIGAMTSVVPEYPWDALRWDPSRDRDFPIDVPWTVYVENYLEGLHIPFVHPELARALDLDAYTTEILPWGTLQRGTARDGEPTVPGSDAAALYFWLWPSTMFNLYPWGVSLNHVDTAGFGRCVVRFRSWVARPELLETGAGAGLDLVELQDQAVVKRVWDGLRSPSYVGGRYAPQELGVHRFHRWLEEALQAASS